MLQKVEGRSTFLATRNATITVAKWGATREFFLATCNATNVALQVARKIASCNMAFSSRASLVFQERRLGTSQGLSKNLTQVDPASYPINDPINNFFHFLVNTADCLWTPLHKILRLKILIP